MSERPAGPAGFSRGRRETASHPRGLPPTAAFRGGPDREPARPRATARRGEGERRGDRGRRVRNPDSTPMLSRIRYGSRNRANCLAPGSTHSRQNGLDSAFTASLVVHRLADRPCAAAVLRKGPVVMAAGNWRRITPSVYSGNRATAHIIGSHRLPPFGSARRGGTEIITLHPA
ncbi:hypothetical protein SMALB_8788 [Streptomyces malaysiensis]|uniref:Uncharacterized protein n=1 Tax=Streptomyces malaysiensis TaxID=92644 RepID=A0A7X6B2Q1_STRMQ|nr:hypothetical protein [Streptomyces malaysiensis]